MYHVIDLQSLVKSLLGHMPPVTITCCFSSMVQARLNLKLMCNCKHEIGSPARKDRSTNLMLYSSWKLPVLVVGVPAWPVLSVSSEREGPWSPPSSSTPEGEAQAMWFCQ